MSQNEAFEAWARQEGLISESHGVRFVNSMCDVAKMAWMASRRAALEEAGTFMDARADELAACGNHTADTMARIYRAEAAAIRALETNNECPD